MSLANDQFDESFDADAGFADADFQAAQWLLRQEAGLSPEAALELAQWLAADEANRMAFAALCHVDAVLASVPEVMRPHVGTAVVVPKRRVFGLSCIWGWRWPGFASLGTLAGMACVMALTVGVVDYFRALPLDQGSWVTARGEQKRQVLPDGSVMTLDTATSVAMAYYRDRREIKLRQGQLMLAVAKDPQRPLHVLAGQSRVTVLGTRFSVRHVGRELSVAVEEGKVAVRQYAGDGKAADFQSRPQQLAILFAGQGIQVQGGKLQPIARVAPQSVGLWRDGRLLFEGVSLSAALDEFERYGDTGLILQDSALGRLRLTGTFVANKPGQFAQLLPHVLPVRLEPLGYGYRILPR